MNDAHGDGEAGRITVERTDETTPFTLRVTGVLDMDSASAFLQRTVSMLDEHDPSALVLSVEELEFVPMHRVVRFVRKADGLVVWDREARVDRVFGSGG